MKKIFLIIPNLNRGGAERVVSILVNHLDPNKFDITLVLLEKKGSYLKDIRDDIRLIDLQTKSVSKSIIPLIKTIRKEKPDLVFSTLGHLNISLMIFKIFLPKKTKFVAREASIPSILNKQEKYPKLFNILYKKLYPKFDKIICQSSYMLNDLEKNFFIEKDKMIVINNPVDFERIEEKLKECSNDILLPIDKKNIIAVGSLERVKGYDLLIKAFTKVESKNIHLSIIGEGREKKNLEELIKQENQEERITLLGFKNNPYIYMDKADLTVLSSRFEGFPNTVLESMACGTPVVAFKCPGGIEEIILENENGWFVEPYDTAALAKAIEQHINHSFNENNIRKSVYRRYNLKYILEKYENLFMEILNEK